MHNRSGAAVALVFAMLLGACQPPSPPPGPPPPVRTTTSLDLEGARTTLAERLLAQGFSVDRKVGGLVVRSSDARFAACPAIWVSELGRRDRRRLVEADRTLATATIRIEEAGPRTRLGWQTSFSGSYLNRLDNIRFEAPCRSTGELERLLETALPS
jgi:hypothetical protein